MANEPSELNLALRAMLEAEVRRKGRQERALRDIMEIASDPAFQSDAMEWIQEKCRGAGIGIDKEQ